MKTLSIIIPCFNESKNLPLLLARFSEVIHRDDIEVILVDNGSIDGSSEVLSQLLPEYPFARSVRVDINQGYGYGILYGLRAAQGRFLGWTHADMQTDPQDVIRGLSILENSSSPERTYVKGKRYGRPFADSFFTVGMSLCTSLLLGTPFWDVNAQPNLFAKTFFETWESPPYDFSLDLYCYYKAVNSRLKIVRFEVLFGQRAYGSSHWNINWRAKIKFIKRTFNFTWKLRKRLHSKYQ
ncbi:MAG: glycosyl transferase family 2 [Phormidesmis priestleyi]|uniref:Glycosyl transferase family 2 n=1 Tax=Phormidesmis priestleyi TaxID=268141 RepID=A0A2W4ZM50_9CYAN|nr:MAG: glycosyl transferase family 2 [Phormidesmis priestleyi]